MKQDFFLNDSSRTKRSTRRPSGEKSFVVRPIRTRRSFRREFGFSRSFVFCSSSWPRESKTARRSHLSAAFFSSISIANKSKNCSDEFVRVDAARSFINSILKGSRRKGSRTILPMSAEKQNKCRTVCLSAVIKSDFLLRVSTNSRRQRTK